ncbi:MAG: lipopolysaccharide transport periplasmic protein LptA [Deltaproteobacteria bacterium]|nr:lipopolysaccharide transport periplasmic protein LptA [Deltaproteobacteria bacterium]
MHGWICFMPRSAWRLFLATFIVTGLTGALFVPAFSAEPQPAKKPVTVLSDTMQSDKSRGFVVFKGNVVAIEDFTLCADELTVTYGKDNEINDMVAVGSVRIFQQEKAATAARAVYDRITRKLVLTGHAEVAQCSDSVKGDKITVSLDDDNAMVQSDNGGRVRAVIMPQKNCVQPSVKGISEEARCKGSR